MARRRAQQEEPRFSGSLPIRTMALNNIIVSFELLVPLRSQSAVVATLKSMGASLKLRSSLWHVKTSLTAAQVTGKLRSILDSHDNVIVIDASHDNAAWYNIDGSASQVLQQQWNRK
jgi:hypothetical protein